MDPLKRSRILRLEADAILEKIGVFQTLEPYGKVTLTGSYYLDTMVFPDIDLYIPKVSISELFKIGSKLAVHKLTTEIVFQKSDIVSLPGGLYLKARFEYGEWGRQWKLDIWSLEESLIKKQMAVMHQFKEKMVDELREKIINYKYSILTAEHRTPTFSGYFIYEAFLDEGMTDFEEVTNYLIANGIKIK